MNELEGQEKRELIDELTEEYFGAAVGEKYLAGLVDESIDYEPSQKAIERHGRLSRGQRVALVGVLVAALGIAGVHLSRRREGGSREIAATPAAATPRVFEAPTITAPETVAEGIAEKAITAAREDEQSVESREKIQEKKVSLPAASGRMWEQFFGLKQFPGNFQFSTEGVSFSISENPDQEWGRHFLLDISGKQLKRDEGGIFLGQWPYIEPKMEQDERVREEVETLKREEKSGSEEELAARAKETLKNNRCVVTYAAFFLPSDREVVAVKREDKLKSGEVLETHRLEVTTNKYGGAEVLEPHQDFIMGCGGSYEGREGRLVLVAVNAPYIGFPSPGSAEIMIVTRDKEGNFQELTREVSVLKFLYIVGQKPADRTAIISEELEELQKKEGATSPEALRQRGRVEHKVTRAKQEPPKRPPVFGKT